MPNSASFIGNLCQIYRKKYVYSTKKELENFVVTKVTRHDRTRVKRYWFEPEKWVSTNRIHLC
ncbi:hypothetical protein C5167_001022 [Papaver somniferum]|uniref:Uncharacterized protein n=1 Tax=Papaver somniferum TaxID=3469 RepID=A0A4Y7KY73_PAPSO|nr:hypothetical protein C5167_001022 [Papaver somniferum]